MDSGTKSYIIIRQNEKRQKILDVVSKPTSPQTFNTLAKMSTATQSGNTEHEILTYVRAQERMENIIQGTPMIMKMKTPLAKALDAMSCIPFVKNSYDINSKDPRNTLTIAGAEAGTLYNPNVDVILEKSVPSPFGKGSETILDPSYRSDGRLLAKM